MLRHTRTSEFACGPLLLKVDQKDLGRRWIGSFVKWLFRVAVRCGGIQRGTPRVGSGNPRCGGMHILVQLVVADGLQIETLHG